MDHLVAPALLGFKDRWHFSARRAQPGIVVSSGVTGTGEDGRVNRDPAAQFEQTFVHLGLYLAAADAWMRDIVEITSYHVGLREHLAEFIAAKDRHVLEPFPAWSAIGVSQLITEGALVEVRVIARDPSS